MADLHKVPAICPAQNRILSEGHEDRAEIAMRRGFEFIRLICTGTGTPFPNRGVRADAGT